MSSEPASNLKAGYRSVGLLLCVGLAGIGFTRLEDRGIIGIPGSPANAMAALAGPAATSEDYDGSPEGFVSIDRASGAPRARIRRLLRDRDIPGAAARVIVGPPPAALAAAADGPIAGDAPAVVQALAPLAAAIPGFTSLAPPVPGTGTPVFASAGTPGGGGGGTGGGGTGGGGTGGNGGGTENPTDPVTPVPEPATWLMLIMGLFGVGAALRRRPALLRQSVLAFP